MSPGAGYLKGQRHVAVLQRVREVESQIDDAIRALPIWRTRRELLLEKILELYRDEVEVVLMRMACGEMEELGAFEDRRRSGAFQVIKWAMEFASESGEALPDVLELQELVELGVCYEAFADALKLANYDAVVIEADDATQTITVFEGGERTGQDANLISHQRRTLPFRPYPSFVADTDQLTLRWNAGDFRMTIRKLAEIAQDRTLTEQGVIEQVSPRGVVPLQWIVARNELPPRWRRDENPRHLVKERCEPGSHIQH